MHRRALLNEQLADDLENAGFEEAICTVHCPEDQLVEAYGYRYVPTSYTQYIGLLHGCCYMPVQSSSLTFVWWREDCYMVSMKVERSAVQGGHLPEVARHWDNAHQ